MICNNQINITEKTISQDMHHFLALEISKPCLLIPMKFTLSVVNQLPAVVWKAGSHFFCPNLSLNLLAMLCPSPFSPLSLASWKRHSILYLQGQHLSAHVWVRACSISRSRINHDAYWQVNTYRKQGTYMQWYITIINCMWCCYLLQCG